MTNGPPKMNLKRLKHYRPNWPWQKFRGSPECLHWNVKDLVSLDAAMRHTVGRKVAIQAGGNLGLFPKRMAEEFKKVYTFEPDPTLFAHMMENAPEKNIIAAQAALGCSHEPVSVACHRRDGTGRHVHEGLTHIAGPGNIPQVMIDDLPLKYCDLIYLDIEGYELNALKGGIETIKKFRPVLALEINSNIAHYQSSKQELREWVLELGYVKRMRLHGDDLYTPK